MWVSVYIRNTKHVGLGHWTAWEDARAEHSRRRTTSTRMRGQMTKIDGIKNSLRHLTQNAVDSYAVASPSAELMWDIPQAAAALPSYAQHIRAITFHSRTRIYNL